MVLWETESPVGGGEDCLRAAGWEGEGMGWGGGDGVGGEGMGWGGGGRGGDGVGVGEGVEPARGRRGAGERGRGEQVRRAALQSRRFCADGRKNCLGARASHWLT